MKEERNEKTTPAKETYEELDLRRERQEQELLRKIDFIDGLTNAIRLIQQENRRLRQEIEYHKENNYNLRKQLNNVEDLLDILQPRLKLKPDTLKVEEDQLLLIYWVQASGYVLQNGDEAKKLKKWLGDYEQ